MARAAKKKTTIPMIVFSRARDIPFNRISLSDSNVRETNVEAGLDELTFDIERREDLVQGLNVRAILDERRQRDRLLRDAGGWPPLSLDRPAREGGPVPRGRAHPVHRQESRRQDLRRRRLAGRECASPSAASPRPVPRLQAHGRGRHVDRGSRHRLFHHAALCRTAPAPRPPSRPGCSRSMPRTA